VTCHSRRQRFAPSTAAASYSVKSTVDSAARKTMMPQPASFHTACEVTSTLNVDGIVMMSNDGRLWSRSTWLSRPAPPSICWKMVTTSTHEKKCGR
jgi:hypothetical protein